MKNILLAFTGGTIGSKVADNFIDTNPQAGFKLLEMFAELDTDPLSINFKTIQPLQILSENLHPQHWQQIIAAIEAEQPNQFDGIILTHGTDTLAFSAAALGLYFNQLQIPMLLVSSDLPLENPLANGWSNFHCAIEFIRRIPQPGVFVAYQNQGQLPTIYQATRLASCLQLSSDFIGIQSQVFMHFDGCKFTPNASIQHSPQKPINLEAKFSARILLITPYPGIDYTQFKLDQLDAVIHDLYHSGTACISGLFGEEHNLLAFIKQCQAHQLPVYLAPAIQSENIYSSTKELLNAGAQIIWNMSLETAYAKLLLAYGNYADTEAIVDFLNTNIAGERI